MSETAGLRAPAGPPPRDSAVVLLVREGAEGRELFWLRRGDALGFGAGMYAFPGGKLDPDDRRVPVEGASGLPAALLACAARELFEETGVLLAEGTLGAEERATLRRRLLEREVSFDGVLSSHGLRLSAARFIPAGRWITPAFLPLGFDARFFLAELPAGQGARVHPAEASEGGFVAPEAALERWRRGGALLHPPTLNALRAMREPTLEAVLRRLREPPFAENHVAARIEFQEGIVLVPQRSETLPPATHTNCFLAGRSSILVVDPGSDDPAERAALLAAIRALDTEGRRASAVFLSHHHHDHASGAAGIARELGLPILAHRATLDQLGLPGRAVGDGEALGAPDFPLVALQTPGHARGHLVLLHPPSRAVLAGDLVSSLSTIVIDPPEGNMVDYLSSLRRIRALPCGTLYPAHGAPVVDGPAKLSEYLTHRQMREDLLLEALRREAATPAELVPRVYADTPAPFHLIAERQTLAHLEKLASEGRARERGGRWEAA